MIANKLGGLVLSHAIIIKCGAPPPATHDTGALICLDLYATPQMARVKILRKDIVVLFICQMLIDSKKTGIKIKKIKGETTIFIMRDLI